jgi:hypothetical protein
MLRPLAIALMAMCFVAPAMAQVPASPTRPSSAAAAKPPVKKKPAQKAKTSAKPAAVAESGPCDMGVISAVGDTFSVQKIGFTVFGNDLTEVPVGWGFDDIVNERAKAIGGGRARRIPYAKGVFDTYYHPKSILLRAADEKLENIVRQIAGTTGCERYLVVTHIASTWNGTNQTINGMGVLNFGPGALNKTIIFSSIMMQVFDGQTFELRRNLNISFKQVLEGLVPNSENGPYMVDNSAYPTVAADAANSAVLRDGARAVLTRTVDRSLHSYFAADTQ